MCDLNADSDSICLSRLGVALGKSDGDHFFFIDTNEKIRQGIYDIKIANSDEAYYSNIVNTLFLKQLDIGNDYFTEGSIKFLRELDPE